MTSACLYGTQTPPGQRPSARTMRPRVTRASSR